MTLKNRLGLVISLMVLALMITGIVVALTAD